ncbi:uncharacterized protein LOC144704350 [Wolffia australiana]
MDVSNKRKQGRQGERSKNKTVRKNSFGTKEEIASGKRSRSKLQVDKEKRRRKRDVASREDYRDREESFQLDHEEDTEEEEDDEEQHVSSSSESEHDDDGVEKETANLFSGSRAFKMAFSKIMKKSSQEDPVLGPVLSAHQKLVVKKLAEEVEEVKAKGDAKKARTLAAEKGHVTPASFLDTKEKFLISVATKGVVKLFNAVNKSQHQQKVMNPSRSKDAKVLAKKKREAFLSEINKTSSESAISGKVSKAADLSPEKEPGWAPLSDSYLLKNSKLKDWDKLDNSSSSQRRGQQAGSSDED